MAAAARPEDEEANTQRLLRRAFAAALPTEVVGEVDEAIVDYLVHMLLETGTDDDDDIYDDEAALEILKGYLPVEEEGGVLDGGRCDVGGLRAQLRTIVAEAAAERKRREQGARRASALSSLSSSSLSRPRDGAESPPPSPPTASSSREEEEDARGRSDSDAEALSFLAQLLPDADPEVVAFVFRVKCFCSQERAADLLLGLAGDGEALASLGEEKERYEASQREARETQRREQKAAEVAAKQAIVDRFADQVVVPLGPASSSSKKKPGPAPIPVPAPQPDSRVRYHNNQPVTLPKGNASRKYIVENLTPEWDGGSRGKVKTKGKRGPGFV